MSAIVEFIVENALYEAEKPYFIDSHSGTREEEALPVRNFAFDKKSIAVTDVRTLPQSEQPTLHQHGFCWVEQKAAALADLKSADSIDFVSYEDEMGGWVKEYFGAATVISLSTNARSTQANDPGFARAGYDAHCDTSKDEVWPIVHRFMTPEEIQKVHTGKYRMRVVHVWRPVGGPVVNYPLAAVDGKTVGKWEDAYYRTDVVSKWYYSETMHLKHNTNHRWLYKGEQTQDEVMIFSQHDSHHPSNICPHIPHAALNLDDAPPQTSPRRSIDMRFVVLSPAPADRESTGIPFNVNRDVESRKQPWKGVVIPRCEDMALPRYVLPTSKTSLCRVGPVSERLQPFVA